VLFAKYNWNEEVKEYEMDRSCSTNGDYDCMYDIGWKVRKKVLTRRIRK
jgi:hypothetical protein